MSSQQGLERVDTSTSLYEDPKVQRLWRDLRPDASLMATAMVLYENVRLRSGREAERVAAQDAAPLWMGDVERAEEALIRCGLLDSEGCLPAKVYEAWIGRAITERGDLRAAWAERKRAQRDRARAQSQGDPVEKSSESPHPVPSDGGEGHRDTGPVPGTPSIHPSISPSSEGTSEPVQADSPDVLDAWYRLTASPPSQRVMAWLEDLSREHGEEAVTQALGEEWAKDTDRKSILSRVQVRLASRSRRAASERRHQKAAQARLEQQALEERVAAMPPGQRAANMARLRGMLEGSGLMTSEQAADVVDGSPRPRKGRRNGVTSEGPAVPQVRAAPEAP